MLVNKKFNKEMVKEVTVAVKGFFVDCAKDVQRNQAKYRNVIDKITALCKKTVSCISKYVAMSIYRLLSFFLCEEHISDLKKILRFTTIIFIGLGIYLIVDACKSGITSASLLRILGGLIVMRTPKFFITQVPIKVEEVKFEHKEEINS